MFRRLALLAALALAGCVNTPERAALDNFNNTVSTANQTASNVRLIHSLIN
ncbi:MAG: hypothetical protein ACK5IP_22645 [Paracoccus sp. (in: a-proteobacteria)]